MQIDANIIYLMLGIILIPCGVVVFYVDQYLARKQGELHTKGNLSTNVYWPIFGPRPWIAVVFIIAGLIFLLLFTFQ